METIKTFIEGIKAKDIADIFISIAILVIFFVLSIWLPRLLLKIWKVNEKDKKVLKENEEKNKIIDLMENYMVENGWEICFDNIYAELNNCNGMERDWSRGDELEKQDIHIFFCKKFLESEE